MTSSSKRQGLIEAVVGFFSAKRQVRRRRDDLERSVLRVREELRNWKTDYEFLREESRAMAKRIGRIMPGMETDFRRTGKNSLDYFAAAEQELASLDENLKVLQKLSAEWHESVESISSAAADIWKRSAAIPGKQFAREVDQKKRDIDAALRNIPYSTRKRIEERLLQAKGRLAAMRTQVVQAEELVSGLPNLKESMLSIDSMGVNQDVSLCKKYETLTRLREQVETGLRCNEYAVAHRVLQNGFKLMATLQHDLETRHDMARTEINLWLTDLDISRRFHLDRFPVHLTPADGQRWRDIKVEISQLISDRAAATRSQYARLSPSKRNLRFSIKQLNDWDTLESFARSAQNNSKYP